MFANKLVDPLVSDLRFGAVHSEKCETTTHPLQSQVRYLSPIQLAQSVRRGASARSRVHARKRKMRDIWSRLVFAGFFQPAPIVTLSCAPR